MSTGADRTIHFEAMPSNPEAPHCLVLAFDPGDRDSVAAAIGVMANWLAGGCKGPCVLPMLGRATEHHETRGETRDLPDAPWPEKKGKKRQ